MDLPAFVHTLAMMRCPMHPIYQPVAVLLRVRKVRRVLDCTGSSLAPAAVCVLGVLHRTAGTLMLHRRDSVLIYRVCRSITIGQPATLKPSKAWPGSWALKCCPTHRDM